ncbi:MAG: hypothetical protein J7501_15775, partial [Bdellovibrio sp.]|nr:hypothetical protein [Bdellovibrio sp.]
MTMTTTVTMNSPEAMDTAVAERTEYPMTPMNSLNSADDQQMSFDSSELSLGDQHLEFDETEV